VTPKIEPTAKLNLVIPPGPGHADARPTWFGTRLVGVEGALVRVVPPAPSDDEIPLGPLMPGDALVLEVFDEDGIFEWPAVVERYEADPRGGGAVDEGGAMHLVLRVTDEPERTQLRDNVRAPAFARVTIEVEDAALEGRLQNLSGRPHHPHRRGRHGALPHAAPLGHRGRRARRGRGPRRGPRGAPRHAGCVRLRVHRHRRSRPPRHRGLRRAAPAPAALGHRRRARRRLTPRPGAGHPAERPRYSSTPRRSRLAAVK
jgi:hypothetical protein